MIEIFNPNFNIDQISIFETDDTKQIEQEKVLENFIGHPFNYKFNPEFENTDNILFDNFSSKENSNQKIINKFSVITQKKRGRLKLSKNSKAHGKFDLDNMIRKIQVSYINFITNFINVILKAIGRGDLKFISLNYFYKRKVNKKHRALLKTKTIKEVLSNKISAKYKTKNLTINIETYEKIKKENINILLNILNKEIFFFFDKIYYKNKRNFNLKEFGLDDLDIQLPINIGLFEDLIIKNKKEIHFEEYKVKLNLCAKKYFIQNKKDIFKCNY